MISKTILNVRRKGQGKKGFKIPVLFPINLGHILAIVWWKDGELVNTRCTYISANGKS